MPDAAAIAREYFESFNRRDWTRFRELLHPDYTYTGGDEQVQRGPDAGVAIGQMFATAMPDAKIDIRRIHSAGSDVAVTEFMGRGTHQGEFMGIPPTGRQATMPVCNVIELRDGKIYAEREYMDMLHLLQQIGAAPIPATA